MNNTNRNEPKKNNPLLYKLGFIKVYKGKNISDMAVQQTAFSVVLLIILILFTILEIIRFNKLDSEYKSALSRLEVYEENITYQEIKESNIKRNFYELAQSKKTSCEDIQEYISFLKSIITQNQCK